MNKSGLPGLEDMDEETQRTELAKLLRRVFSTKEGKTAFNMLLNDLFYFQPAKTESEQALSNYARFLVTERMGIIDTISITDHMLETDIEEEK